MERIDPFEGASDAYAQWTRAFEEQLNAGTLSRTGQLESMAAQASTVSGVNPKISDNDRLFGTHLRKQLAYFTPAPGWEATRRRRHALGPLEEADMEKLTQVLSTANAGDQARGERIRAALEQSIQDDRQQLFVRGRMGEILGA